MKRFLFAILALLPIVPSVWAQGESLSITGVVINGADGNPLPMCIVQLMQDGRCRTQGVSDYAGNYVLPPTAPGRYDVLITQFGDTLMHCRGIELGRDTRVRCTVMPPSYKADDTPVAVASGGFRQLKPVLVVGRYNMLAITGHLITNPDDPRLWNMSGKMDHEEPQDISFFYSIYKQFYKLKAQGYDIASPFELIYPEVHHPASDSAKYDYHLWVLGFKL